MNWRKIFFSNLIPASLMMVVAIVFQWLYDFPVTWGKALYWFCFGLIFTRIFKPTWKKEVKNTTSDGDS